MDNRVPFGFTVASYRDEITFEHGSIVFGMYPSLNPSDIDSISYEGINIRDFIVNGKGRHMPTN
jgi:hypothetical protein